MVDSKEDDKNTKEVLPLTFVTSHQPVSEVNALSCSQGNLTSNYQNINFLRVPIAKAESESDFETPENEDEDEDEEEEEKEKHSEVNPIQFYSGSEVVA